MPPTLLGKHFPLACARAQRGLSLARPLRVVSRFRSQVSAEIGGAIA